MTPLAFVDALAGKLTQLRKYGGAWSAFGRGLRLLLQGRLRTFLTKLSRGSRGPTFDAGDDYHADQAYAAWRQQRLWPTQELDCANKVEAPLLSVLLTVAAGEESLLHATLASLRRQTYAKWEMHEVAGMATFNAALSLAQGEFIVFLDAGDELADHALLSLAKAIIEDPTLDLVATDDDQIDASGQHRNPHFKPGWSPETLLAQPELGASVAIRTALVRDLGGLRAVCADLAIYNLVLRVAARTPRVRHLADILFHRRIPTLAPTAPTFPVIAEALNLHLQETGRDGLVEPMTGSPGHRVRFRITGKPLVSILIPTAFARRRGSPDRALVLDCLHSIRSATSWPHYEIIVIASRPAPADLQAEVAALGATIITTTRPFNFATAINDGARQAHGSQFLLLNDDTEVITPDWLESMLEYAQQPDIGAVGARLLFPHGRVQHTGLHLLDGKPVHAFYGYPGDDPGYRNSMNMPRNYLAVTGACLMTRREVFQQLGGLDACFALDCNDIDYCLRLIKTGRRIVCTPYAQLLHHEAFTRRGMDTAAFAAFKARWGEVLDQDPYYNANFDMRNANYQIDASAAGPENSNQRGEQRGVSPPVPAPAG